MKALAEMTYEEMDAIMAGGRYSICWGHHAIEDVPEDFFLICPECFHVYATAQDLVDMYNRVVSEMNSNPFPNFDGTYSDPIPLKTLSDVDKIYFCQVCMHDF